MTNNNFISSGTNSNTPFEIKQQLIQKRKISDLSDDDLSQIDGGSSPFLNPPSIVTISTA